MLAASNPRWEIDRSLEHLYSENAMRASYPIFWAQDKRSRSTVCSLLVAMLVLSSISFNVFITHAHAGEEVHTHVSRILDVRDIDHDHGTHHGHHPRPLVSQIDEAFDDSDGCGNESESTVVAASLDKLLRRDGDSTRHLLELAPTSLLIGSIDSGFRAWPSKFRTRFNHDIPSSSVQSLRCTILLI